MTADRETFVEIVGEVLRRYCRQNHRPDAPALVGAHELGGRLWALVQKRGLPPALAAGEPGTPDELPEETCALLLAEVLGAAAPAQRELLGTPLRQLIKACFHGEFKVCRDSFREVSDDGSCRRQQLTRVRGRVSGTHCVDCPYWIALTPEQHVRFLAREWQPARCAELTADLPVFLPEDFRRLRHWLYAAARRI